MRQIKMAVPEDSNHETGSPLPGEPAFLVIGKLRRPHGLDGEILMEVITDFPERLVEGKLVYVGEKHEQCCIEYVRNNNALVIMKFKGIGNSEEAGKFRNLLVYSRTDTLPPLPKDEYYYHQIIGMSAVDQTGHVLGYVSEILETGANQVYVIKTPENKEILLPVLPSVILDINLEERMMRVCPLEWL
jgi:16S rRNA processing protein RimM